MTPLGQTFYIDEPVGGAAGVVIPQIDLFFRTKSSTFGVEIQIRSVENGYPTEKILPYARAYLDASAINTSSDGSIATSFVFDTPVYCRAGIAYFLSVSPVGGSPDYSIWIGEVGQNDLSTGVTITTNNPTGTLFISTDSRTFTPLLSEDLKMIIYRANFTATNGTLAFTQESNEFIKVANVIGTFIPGEKVFISNVAVSSFLTGNVSATSNQIGFTTHGFGVNDLVCVLNGNSAWVRTVTGNTSTTITLSDSNLYTNTAAKVGLIRGGTTANNDSGANTLFALCGYSNGNFISLYNSTATQTNNFDNCAGRLVVGSLSTAIATANTLFSLKYNAVNPSLSYFVPTDTTITSSLKGMNTSNTVDTSTTSLNINKLNELVDYERVLRSKSADLNSGSNSFTITNIITTSNTKVSPIVYTDSSSAYLRGNKVVSDTQLSGYTLTISNTGATAIPTFNVGSIITQATSNASGTLIFANTTFMRVGNVTGKFTNGYLVTDSYTSNTANVTVAVQYGEDIGIYYSPSRYISKKVVLADGQDAEDIKIYLTAYKPQNSNILVYGKFLNNSDSDLFDNKVWTELILTTSASLYSSRTNFDDFLELQYNLPYSNTITSGANSTSTSTDINSPVQLSTQLKTDDFVYLLDNTTNKFLVKQVKSLNANGNVVTLYSNSTITSSNVTVGKVYGLKNPQGAFLWDSGNNIIRYVSNTGSVYDGYKTFAIKIVPTSSNSATVPHITDMRAIALQI